MIKWIKGILLVLFVIVLIVLISLRIITYAPSDQIADLLLEEHVTVTRHAIEVMPKDAVIATLVFYQGGLVDTAAYLALANQLSEHGIHVILPKMPLNLAIINRFAFNDFYEAGSTPYFIAGHSLGGASATYVVSTDPEKVAGIILLAAYPPESVDLSHITQPVLSITASEDKILNQAQFLSTQRLLPSHTEYVVIDGGNHAYFGSYGPQRNDGNATITAEQQLMMTVFLIVQMIEKTLQ